MKNDKEHVEEVWQYLSTLSYTEKQNVIKVLSVYAMNAYAEYVGTREGSASYIEGGVTALSIE